MRWLVLVGILAALVTPGYAAEKMTVRQLEQVFAQRAAQSHETTKKRETIASDEIVDISDGDLLQQLDRDDELIPRIAGIELTERLSTLTMYHLIGKYNLGAHVQQALEQLADRSALLKLPPNEQLSKPRPGTEEQHEREHQCPVAPSCTRCIPRPGRESPVTYLTVPRTCSGWLTAPP